MAVPFVLLAVALKVLFALVLLPLKLIGEASSRACSGSCSGLLGGLFGLLAGGIGLVGGLLVLFFVLVLLPARAAPAARRPRVAGPQGVQPRRADA